MCTNIYDNNGNDEDDICDDNDGCEWDKHGVANMIHIVMVKMMMMMMVMIMTLKMIMMMTTLAQ